MVTSNKSNNRFFTLKALVICVFISSALIIALIFAIKAKIIPINKEDDPSTIQTTMPILAAESGTPYRGNTPQGPAYGPNLDTSNSEGGNTGGSNDVGTPFRGNTPQDLSPGAKTSSKMPGRAPSTTQGTPYRGNMPQGPIDGANYDPNTAQGGNTGGSTSGTPFRGNTPQSK